VEGCIIEDVTEEDDTEQQQQQQQRRPQQRSAADHTYDRASSRWERFDADAAMRSDDSDGEQPNAANGRSARPPQPAAGRSRSGIGASARKAGASPPTPSAQPVLPPQRRAVKRAGAAEATTGMWQIPRRLGIDLTLQKQALDGLLITPFRRIDLPVARRACSH